MVKPPVGGLMGGQTGSRHKETWHLGQVFLFAIQL
jgi:hypothetical protein